MTMHFRLRFRAFLLILPLVIAVIGMGGLYASLKTRVALTGLANRYLAFKAEQLRDYFFSEWDMITKLGLEKYPEYGTAVEKSFRSYAYSLLRSPTELIAVLDGEGNAVMLIRQREPAAEEAPAAAAKPAAGWFSGVLLGEKRVGAVFELPPKGWTVAVTESEEAFFADVAELQRAFIAIIIGAAAVMTVFIGIFIGYIVRPVEKLAATMVRVAETGDLNIRAEVEYEDEIGVLAHRFNRMISALLASSKRIEVTSRAEHEARRAAEESEEETLMLLGRVSDFRDEETGRHLRRIGNISALFSALLGQTGEEQELMRFSSPLHDIGKISVPDAILRKPGPLDAAELEIMKKHTIMGYELLKGANGRFLVEGARIALTHHEKWDGSGYPSGLRGSDIPLSGRIVGIADTIDALLSERPYKRPWSMERMRNYILEQGGKAFDPCLTNLFAEHFEEFRSVLGA